MKFLDIGQVADIYADGIHDDAKAIQRCLDEMKDGGTIYFPDGTYLISHCLIFYSNQWLKFSDKAVLLRSSDCDPLTKYMLASYSEPDVKGYEGTHDVVISGGVFDGNASLTEKLTILNTVHCTNITVKNCTFVHCAFWHCIELNSTKDALVLDCVFDGKSYTAMREDLTSELIQIDAPEITSYGPVYNCDDILVDFLPDKTPCCDIKIASCIFKCGGFTAIGHHGNNEHTDIKIYNNVFTGLSGNEERSRGFITFMEKVHDVDIAGNAFISESVNEKCLGILTNNPDKSSVIAKDNTFIGKFDEYYVGGITVNDN
ncbi:MAG: hypothetical protein IKV76_02575 [Clostridia bacterium]|nr:hypothetical protein [Clostridia bacterium]